MSWLGKLISLGAAPLTGGASLTPMLIGAGLGAAKHFAVDKPKEAASRKQAAEIMRYSPWTGMQAGPIKSSNLFGSLLGGAALGGVASGAMAKAGEKAAAAAGKGAPSFGVADKFSADIGKIAAEAPRVAPMTPAVGASMAPSLGVANKAMTSFGGMAAGAPQMAAAMPQQASKFSFLESMRPNIRTPYTGEMLDQQSASPWNYLARR